MRLPTVQAVERAMSRFGACLRYSLRFVTPPAALFCALAFFGQRYQWALYSSGLIEEPRLAYLMAMKFSGYLTALAMAMCLIAALCTVDRKVRSERLLIGYLVVLTILFFVLMTIPTIR